MLRSCVFAMVLTASIHFSEASLAASNVSGYVHDTSGSALADAHVMLSNADSGKQQEVWTNANGRFSFAGNPAGQYIFKIKRTGMVSVLRAFTLEAEEERTREYTMVAPGNVADIEVVTGSAEAVQKPIRISTKVAEANLVTKVQPSYPINAKQAGVEGQVELIATISKEGVPAELRITASPDDDLSEAALDAVRQWRYKPSLLNGEPIQVVTKIVVNFTLQR